MSKEEMLLEQIKNYFEAKKSLFSVDIILDNGRLMEGKK